MTQLTLLYALAMVGVENTDKGMKPTLNEAYKEVKEVIAQFDYLKNYTFYGKALNMGNEIFTLKFLRFETSDYPNSISLVFRTLENDMRINYSLQDYGTMFALTKRELKKGEQNEQHN